MSLSIRQIKIRIDEIDRLADPHSDRYGRLLCWQNPFNPAWHYGIGLSDTYIFDTGRSLLPFEKIEVHRVNHIDSIAFNPEPTIQRLKQALYAFADWNYNLTNWNCEHLGRLIATDRPRCYQSQPLWWLCNLTPEGDHKLARSVFENYASGSGFCVESRLYRNAN